MPSAVMGYPYQKNGRFFADFRFHRSKSMEVSSLLMNCLETYDESALEFIVSGSGEILFIKEMNALIPLSLITNSVRTINENLLEKSLSANKGIVQIEKRRRQISCTDLPEFPPIEKDGAMIISDEGDGGRTADGL